MYLIEAHWPNCQVEPKRTWRAHRADALVCALDLVASNEHTTISVRINDLEVMRFWGQVKDFP